MGSHMGDLPNLVVAANGAGSIVFDVAATADNLFDADGTAIVIHAGPDDERTDPSGNSGARVACAVLNRVG
jgi:Cu-Zn family superoxide dismutase